MMTSPVFNMYVLAESASVSITWGLAPRRYLPEPCILGYCRIFHVFCLIMVVL